MRLYASVALLFFSCIISASALRFYVASNEKKCLKEEIHRNVVLTGEYEFTEAIGNTASVHVRYLLIFIFNRVQSLFMFQGNRYARTYALQA